MLSPGDVVDDKYKVVRLIGEGGMGAVFEAENTAISRRVAIKVLHPHAAMDSDAVMRFKREARAAGKIGNDHILEILDLGSLADGSHYMVMEYLDGEALSTRIERGGPIPPAELVDLASQLLAGLGAAHEAGIIHRDLKPDNIFIMKQKAGRQSFVKIIDFGISKFQRLGDEGGQMRMTQTGTLMGTPYYMSSEQAKGTPPPDHRADIYAVGVILYEALSGRVPFDAKSFNELMFKIALEEAPPLTEVLPGVDPSLAAIIHQAMAKVPDGRHSSCAELSHALTRWQSGAGPAAHAPIAATAVAPNFPQGTDSNWAHTGSAVHPVVIPKRSPVPLLLALAAVGFVLLVGGSFVVYKLVGSGGTAAAASANPELADVVPPVEETPPEAPAQTANEDPAVPPSASATAEEPPPPDEVAKPAVTAVKPVAVPKFKPVAPAPAPAPDKWGY